MRITRCNLDGHADEFDVHIDEKTTKQTPDPSNDARHFPHDLIDSTSPPPSTKHINGSLLHDVHVEVLWSLGCQSPGVLTVKLYNPKILSTRRLLTAKGHSQRRRLENAFLL